MPIMLNLDYRLKLLASRVTTAAISSKWLMTGTRSSSRPGQEPADAQNGLAQGL
jgi:hypothetical protein